MHQSLSFVLLIDFSTVRDLFDYYMTWLSFLMSSMHICSIFYIILSIVLYRLVQLMQILTPDAPYNFYFKMCTEMLWIARMRDASNFSNIYIYIYIYLFLLISNHLYSLMIQSLLTKTGNNLLWKIYWKKVSMAMVGSIFSYFIIIPFCGGPKVVMLFLKN